MRAVFCAHTHRLDQGSAVTGLGCDGGGGTGSGLQWGRRHCWDRARGTRTRLRARVTRLRVRRQGTARAWRGLKLWARDDSRGNVTENEVALPFL